MGDILFCEKDNPIIRKRLKKKRRDGIEVYLISISMLLLVPVLINESGLAIRILPPTILLIFLSSLGIVAWASHLFGSTALCITEEGITLPGLPFRDIVKRKGFFLAWEDVEEVVHETDRVHPEYGVLSVTVLWIRTRAGRLYPIGITDVVDEEKFIEVMKEICRRKEVKYIESAFPPTRIFRKAYAKQFET